jgi:hypothetical protein
VLTGKFGFKDELTIGENRGADAYPLRKIKKEKNFMKNKLLLSMAAVSTLLLAPAIGFTEDKDAEVRTLTGCLSKAEGAHEYKLTAENGATWELHSKTVKLSPHAGHTVTVTGRVRNADMHGAKEKVKDEMKEHGMDKDATEHGHLRVTSVKMVSDSCKK